MPYSSYPNKQYKKINGFLTESKERTRIFHSKEISLAFGQQGERKTFFKYQLARVSCCQVNRYSLAHFCTDQTSFRGLHVKSGIVIKELDIRASNLSRKNVPLTKILLQASFVEEPIS